MSITELGLSLRWPPNLGVVMITGYFDESGIQKPHLEELTIGGAFATFEVWQEIETEWKAVLDAEGVKCFHATEFEHYRGEFEWFLPNGDRDRARHERFLNSLLDILDRHPLHYQGFTNGYVPGKPRKRFADLYERGIIDVILDAQVQSDVKWKEPVGLVFAVHKEFSRQRIESYQQFIDYEGSNPRIRSVSAGRPEDIPALQVADLAAYEMSRQHERYPLKRLMAGAEHFDVKWSAA